VPVGLIMRSRLQETVDADASTIHPSTGHVFSALLKNHLRPLVIALMLITSGTIAAYIGNYMTTYALSTLHMATGASMSATAVTGACVLVFSLIGGWLSDRVGRKPVYLLSKLALTAVAYPAFVAINQHHTLGALLLMAGLMGALTALGSVALVVITECFPKSVRSAGLSTVYALAVTVLVAAVLLGMRWRRSARDPVDKRIVLAVLPFEDWSDNSHHAYLCNGMTQELITLIDHRVDSS